MSEYDAGICETLGTGRLVSIDAESATNDLVKKTGQDEATPVDLDPILRLLELERVEEDIEGDGYLVRLPSGNYEMLIRRGDAADQNRQRFTIAHEMGHYFSERLEATKDDQPTRIKVEDAPQKKVEDWCNTFASSLLMPAAAVHRELGGPNGLLDPYKIERAAEEFKVSLEAFCYRAAHLFHATLATMDMGSTRIHRLSPKYLDSVEHRSRALIAMQQQVQKDKSSNRIIGGRSVQFDGKSRVVFAWRGKSQ